jgi:hypothetical protein
MSALPPKADIGARQLNVRFVPKADIADRLKMTVPLARVALDFVVGLGKIKSYN